VINRVVLVTGGFDPLHSGHIEYFKAAKQLGNILVVGVNSDAWLERKKGRAFMPSTERVAIIENLKVVDHCVLFDDSDGSAREAIRNVKMMYPNSQIVFANGGDRTAKNIPEMSCKDVEFIFGVGGQTKLNSSSWILEEWKAPKTIRSWGYYRILHDVSGTKVKELTIDPGKSLSMQRHEYRSEYWLVTEGKCCVASGNLPVEELCRHDTIEVPEGAWHQLSNPYDQPCRIVEIQHGARCIEDDIERR
jgi:D-beta-D-heptose 7-phosphate kinase/D-beta-D-heptose 1-phosphate adenosyltransferase